MTDRSTMQQHRWLTYSWKKEEDLPSACYDRLLKPYASWNGMTLSSSRSSSGPCFPPAKCLSAGQRGSGHGALLSCLSARPAYAVGPGAS
jgi:hypothetical protein